MIWYERCKRESEEVPWEKKSVHLYLSERSHTGWYRLNSVRVSPCFSHVHIEISFHYSTWLDLSQVNSSNSFASGVSILRSLFLSFFLLWCLCASRLHTSLMSVKYVAGWKMLAQVKGNFTLERREVIKSTEQMHQNKLTQSLVKDCMLRGSKVMMQMVESLGSRRRRRRRRRKRAKNPLRREKVYFLMAV